MRGSGLIVLLMPALFAAGCHSNDPGGNAGFGVSDSAARGCEVLLTEGSAQVKVDKVAFDDSLQGTFVREAPRVAISFVAKTDAPIAAGAVKLTITGDAAQVQVKKVNCVDGKGAALSGATVNLQ